MGVGYNQSIKMMNSITIFYTIQRRNGEHSQQVTKASMIRLHTWSIAHGIRHGTLVFPLKISGNEELKLGAAWMAGKEFLPMFVSPLKPKIPQAWLLVTRL